MLFPLFLGAMSYFALSKYFPVSEQRDVLFLPNFGISLSLLQSGGGV